jgi:hypothetical protein
MAFKHEDELKNEGPAVLQNGNNPKKAFTFLSDRTDSFLHKAKK